MDARQATETSHAWRIQIEEEWTVKESLFENKSAYQSCIISKIELSTDVSLDHVVPELFVV